MIEVILGEYYAPLLNICRGTEVRAFGIFELVIGGLRLYW